MGVCYVWVFPLEFCENLHCVIRLVVVYVWGLLNCLEFSFCNNRDGKEASHPKLTKKIVLLVYLFRCNIREFPWAMKTSLIQS